MWKKTIYHFELHSPQYAEHTRATKQQWKIPPIYFLPKIHKRKHPDTNTFPGRPIIGASGNILQPLDLYLANLTSPILHLIPNSLRDTTHLLQDLSRLRKLPSDCLLFSADVVALYPSIPWDEGLDAAADFYAAHFNKVENHCKSHSLLPPPPPTIFRTILATILANNVFHLQERRWFKQLNGTAMGCSMSVFFANTFMAHRMRFLLTNPLPDLLYIGRYIDDIIGVWANGNTDDIIEAFSPIIDKHIKLTWVFHPTSLEALDVKLSLKDGAISTSLYRKPTDGHQFLLWNSNHPLHLRRSIPFSQLLRLRRICSSDEIFELEAQLLLDRFRSRGYPESVLLLALNKVRKINRTSLLFSKLKSRKQKQNFCFVSSFDTNNYSHYKKAVKSFYKNLLEDEICSERVRLFGRPGIPTTPPTFATRVGKNLGATLGPLFKRALPSPEHPSPTPYISVHTSSSP